MHADMHKVMQCYMLHAFVQTVFRHNKEEACRQRRGMHAQAVII